MKCWLSFLYIAAFATEESSELGIQSLSKFIQGAQDRKLQKDEDLLISDTEDELEAESEEEEESLQAQATTYIEPIAADKSLLEAVTDDKIIRRTISDLDLDASVRLLDKTLPLIPFKTLKQTVWEPDAQTYAQLIEGNFNRADQIAYLAASLAYVVGTLLPEAQASETAPIEPEKEIVEKVDVAENEVEVKVEIAASDEPTEPPMIHLQTFAPVVARNPPATPPLPLSPFTGFIRFSNPGGVADRLPLISFPTPPPTSNNRGWGFLGTDWSNVIAQAANSLAPRGRSLLQEKSGLSEDEKSRIWRWYLHEATLLGDDEEAQDRLIHTLFEEVIKPRTVEHRSVKRELLDALKVPEPFLERVRHGARETEKYLASRDPTEEPFHPVWFEAASLFLSSLPSHTQDDTITALEALDPSPADARFSAFLETHPVTPDLQSAALLIYRLHRALKPADPDPLPEDSTDASTSQATDIRNATELLRNMPGVPYLSTPKANGFVPQMQGSSPPAFAPPTPAANPMMSMPGMGAPGFGPPGLGPSGMNAHTFNAPPPSPSAPGYGGVLGPMGLPGFTGGQMGGPMGSPSPAMPGTSGQMGSPFPPGSSLADPMSSLFQGPFAGFMQAALGGMSGGPPQIGPNTFQPFSGAPPSMGNSMAPPQGPSQFAMGSLSPPPAQNPFSMGVSPPAYSNGQFGPPPSSRGPAAFGAPQGFGPPPFGPPSISRSMPNAPGVFPPTRSTPPFPPPRSMATATEDSVESKEFNGAAGRSMREEDKREVHNNYYDEAWWAAQPYQNAEAPIFRNLRNAYIPVIEGRSEDSGAWKRIEDDVKHTLKLPLKFMQDMRTLF